MISVVIHGEPNECVEWIDEDEFDWAEPECAWSRDYDPEDDDDDYWDEDGWDEGGWDEDDYWDDDLDFDEEF